MIDFVYQAACDLLEDTEVEYKKALRIDRALDRDTHTVVVPVERFALMPSERDEVCRGEHQVVLADLHAKVALHGSSLWFHHVLNYNNEQRGARQIGSRAGITAVGRIPQPRVKGQ